MAAFVEVGNGCAESATELFHVRLCGKAADEFGRLDGDGTCVFGAHVVGIGGQTSKTAQSHGRLGCEGVGEDFGFGRRGLRHRSSLGFEQGCSGSEICEHGQRLLGKEVPDERFGLPRREHGGP